MKNVITKEMVEELQASTDGKLSPLESSGCV
jgi:hypothetical protein